MRQADLNFTMIGTKVFIRHALSPVNEIFRVRPLRSFFGAPKLSHVLRCPLCPDHTMLARLDEMMREGLERIINISLNKYQWMQASLPIRDGGLGLRRVSSLASSAYLASAACTLELQSAILTKCTTVPDAYFEEVLAARHDTLPSVIDPLPVKQGAWDR